MWLLFSINATAQCYQLVWQDEFDGHAIDPAKWSFEVSAIGGWNNELQYYTDRPENAYLKDGKLVLEARKENFTGPGGTREYTSAKLISLQKGDWTYGKFEVRAKLPMGKGMWPAIWMMPSRSHFGGWPSSGEIDILELLGHEPVRVHGSLHYGASIPGHKFSTSHYDLPSGNFADDFHVFAVHWRQDTIQWSVDGHVYKTITRNDILPEHWPFLKDFHLILNLSVGGDWPGAPDDMTKFPNRMEIDHVRVYQDLKEENLSIKGHATVSEGQLIEYQVPGGGQDYIWEVPDDAQIVSGAGSAHIKVRFGSRSGNVGVNFKNACGVVLSASMPIEVIAGQCIDVRDDFHRSRFLNYSYSTGQFVQDHANPAPSDEFPNLTVGRYEVNPESPYDALNCFTVSLIPADALASGEKHIVVDVLSPQAGLKIEIFLENNYVSPIVKYPDGRHSKYSAITTKNGAWETLVFRFVDRYDASVSEKDVNSLAFNFDPNRSGRKVFYIGKIVIVGQGVCNEDDALNLQDRVLSGISIYPNPAVDTLRMELKDLQSGNWSVMITDMEGKVVYKDKLKRASGNKMDVSVKDLNKGIYLLSVNDGKRQEQVRFVKQ